MDEKDKAKVEQFASKNGIALSWRRGHEDVDNEYYLRGEKPRPHGYGHDGKGR